ncbi:interferon alpha-inducible protein 27-like protein 2B isoform X1 [Archocentrus centrarchus]|uniref:interferon alpha-inducible protein 27-like protein 2B isoform X1 n=1 Tax=Archocentrus centrarchus TaxID=63155 RepID=UPI0011EA4A81|nr:interferon alpha-inducible protein 27-like protein 2B isoform X1 [Archocentrus centrarchus]
MAPNARQALISKIQEGLLKLSRSQLQSIISSIKDVSLANGIEELSDDDLRKLVFDYVTGDQLRSQEDEGTSELHHLDELITQTAGKEPAHLPTEDPGSDSPTGPTDTDPKRSSVGVGTIVAITAGAVGAVGAVVSAPLVLGAMGFTSAGIAAGSYAASMMSAAAVANGGGVAAGSLVAVLQSAGAAGLSGAATAAVASAGAGAGAVLGAGANQLRLLFSRK